jgi:hypothetical protein
MPQASTPLMARILGPFLVVFGAALPGRFDAFEIIVPAFFQDGPLVIVTGALSLALGAMMIAVHTRWDGPTAIIVTVLGWVTFVRSALMLLAPTFVSTIAISIARLPALPLILAAVLIMLGLWLTFVGWFKSNA